jgi:hypothetical protein
MPTPATGVLSPVLDVIETALAPQACHVLSLARGS